MQSLKTSLKIKLQSLENSQTDQQEALPRGADIIAQCKAIDNWHNVWVRDALNEKLHSTESNGPFFIAKPKQFSLDSSGNNDILRMMEREARTELFRKRELLCLLPVEVKMLEELLCRNSSNWSPPSLPSSPVKPMNPNERSLIMDVPVPLDYLISLEGYQKTISEFSDYLKFTRESNGYLLSDSLWVLGWFTTKLFVRLVKQETEPLVQVSSIMEYVFKKLQLYQLRLELMKYDADGNGSFTKEKLRLYLHRQWRNFTVEKELNSLIKSYIEAIITETFFLLDPHRTNRVKIVELLGSRLLPQLRTEFWDGQMYKRFSTKMSVFQELAGNDLNAMIPVSSFCEKLPEISQKIWEPNNRIKQKRLRILQPVFKRLVHIYEHSNSGISFNTFLEFSYAWEYLDTCFSSISYFFRVLDTDDKGYLEETDLQNHYRNIEEILKLKSLRKSSSSPRNSDKAWVTPSFLHIQAEIRDLLAREGISRITPENLFKAKDGYMLISYLVNVEWSMDYRVN